MNYNNHIFQTGEVLEAEHLNAMQNGIIKGAGKYERFYPQCTDGYYSSSLSITSSVEYECCELDVRHLKNSRIYLNIDTNNVGYIALKDTSGSTILSTTENITELDIPENGKTLYLSNSIKKKPDWYIETIQTNPNNSVYLFYEDFTKPDSIEYYTIRNSKINGTLTSGSGLVLNTGFSNAVIINKRIILNCFNLESNVTVSPTGTTYTEKIVMGARCLDGSTHGTVVTFDFANKKIIINKKNDGSSAGETYKSVDIGSDILNGQKEFKLLLERKDAAIIATLINKSNNASASVSSPPTSTSSEGTLGYNSGGMSYDCPQILVTAGSPVIKNFFGTCKRNVNVLLLGDSITQGSRIVFNDCWANRVIEYFGNSLQGGRGSGAIRNCVNNARSLMPVCRPKVLVVTIGTNNSTSIIKEQYMCFKALADYYGALLIVNTPWACDARAQCESMKTKILSLNLNTCRFDLATKIDHIDSNGQDTSYFAEDNVHLNVSGNDITYQYFISQFGYLKDNM